MIFTRIIGVLLGLLGIFGIVCGFLAFGDIGIACMIGGATALLSGAGFIRVSFDLF